MNLYRLLVLCPLLLLGACSSTEFVNLPDGEQSPCDERLIGSWKVVTISESGEQEEPDYLSIEADCKRFVGSSMEDGEPEAEDLQEETEIQFVRNGKVNFVGTRDKNTSPESDGREQTTYTLYRYTFKRDQVSLFGINHERAGELIRTGKLHGRSVVNAPSSGQRTVQNEVDSAGAELTRALNDRKIFEKKPVMVLERISDEAMREAFMQVKGKGKTGD